MSDPQASADTPGHPPPGDSGRSDGPAGDLVAGVLTAGFGTAVVVRVQGFPSLAGGYPGPALFPGIIGILMVVFGLTLVGQSARRRRRRGARPARAAPSRNRGRAVSNALAVLLAVVIYLLVVEILGFLLTMAGLLFCLMLKLRSRLVVAVPASIVATLAIYAFFRGLLLVPLPTGMLG